MSRSFRDLTTVQSLDEVDYLGSREVTREPIFKDDEKDSVTIGRMSNPCLRLAVTLPLADLYGMSRETAMLLQSGNFFPPPSKG